MVTKIAKCDVCKRDATWISEDGLYCLHHCPIDFPDLPGQIPRACRNGRERLRADIKFLKEVSDQMVSSKEDVTIVIGNRFGVIVDNLMGIDRWFEAEERKKKK